MNRHVVLRSPSSDKERPLLNPQQPTCGARAAEVAGGTAAECAAVCCCCPCAVAGLVVLAVYKVPAGLCRKALRNGRRRVVKPRKHECGSFDIAMREMDVARSVAAMEELLEMTAEKAEMEEFEGEMLKIFYGSGFWRSPSQRD